MKIAIQGHLTRGKEVIQILESLGGKTKFASMGFNERYYYYINPNGIIVESLITIKTKDEFKLYTLEEFEKEFPFKVGDVVSLGSNNPYTIIALELYMNRLRYKLDDGLYYSSKTLIKCKKMKEERNITLTLDKAKEWYNKGGELKEIALQAFSEKELNPLPRSWEEFYEGCKCTSVLDRCLFAISTNTAIKYVDKFKALIKLQYLRDCWRHGWVPDYTKTYKKYRIKKLGTGHIIDWSTGVSDFLVFQSEGLAKEFFECFKDLIEEAGDLI